MPCSREEGKVRGLHNGQQRRGRKPRVGGVAGEDGRRRAGTRSPSFMHPGTCAAECGSWRGVADTPPSRTTVGAQGRGVHARPRTEPKRGGLRRHPPARPPRLFPPPPPWPASGGPERAPVPSCPAVDATGSGLRLCKGWHGGTSNRPPSAHARSRGGGGCPTCASGGVSSVHGRWRWLGTVERAPHPPLRGAGATLPHPLHTLTPPTAAMREGPRGATADALFYHARVGERARTPTCATPQPSNALTSESRRGLPAVLPVYPLTRVDTSK